MYVGGWMVYDGCMGDDGWCMMGVWLVDGWCMMGVCWWMDGV